MNTAEANLEVVDSQVVISDFRTSNSPIGYSHICPPWDEHHYSNLTLAAPSRLYCSAIGIHEASGDQEIAYIHQVPCLSTIVAVFIGASWHPGVQMIMNQLESFPRR